MRVDVHPPQLRCLFLIPVILMAIAVPPVQAQSIKDLYERAAQSFYEGKYGQAVSDYEKIIEMDPNFAPAYNALGLAIKVKGATSDEAAYYFKKAIELDPKFVSAYDNLGKLYYSAGNMDEAEANFAKGLEVDPANESILLSMGWVNLLGRGDGEKAMKYFKAVTKISESAMGYFGQGICYLSEDKRMQVIDIVTKLRSTGQEGLAKDLETMMRENRTLIKSQQMPSPNAMETSPRNPAAPAAQNTPPAPPQRPSSPEVPTGWQEYNDEGEFQVRLRGKLNEQ